jgi:hypothetical protein
MVTENTTPVVTAPDGASPATSYTIASADDVPTGT